MASYITLTTTRATLPDPVALIATVQAATGDPTAVLLDPTHSGFWTGKKADAWTAPQIAAAQTALDTVAEMTPQMEAQRTIDSYPIHFRALVLALVDELNILRGLHSLAPRTPAQALKAIRDKAATLNGS